MEIDRLVKEGVFEPIESTQWATPIVPVIKADGQAIRLCGDYKRTLNRALTWNPYPMPSVNEMLATLEPGVRHFCKLDLAQAYQQLTVDEESARAQAVVTHKGIFKVRRLQFGVSVAPQIFQRCINNRLSGIPGTVPYFDDILISGASLEQLFGRVRTVLSRLAADGLKLQKNKCVFFVDSINFLGYELNSAGVQPLESKIRAIQDAKRPTNVKELQSFLGLINFYCLFLKGKTEIAEPLHRLLNSKVTWTWQQKEEEAFQKLKRLLTSDALLVHYDPNRPLVLSCDASPWGVGAVLSHTDKQYTERPIAFFSKTLNATERRYSQLDREACAIIRSVKKFHNYLYGRSFTIKTDHKPLLGLLGEGKSIPESSSPRMTRWALFLSNYNYVLQYTPGKELGHADAMSRMPQDENVAHKEEETVVGNVLMIENLPEKPLKADIIAKMTGRDPVLGQVLNFVNAGWPNSCDAGIRPFQMRREELSIYKGCLLWGNRVVIPPKAQRQLLEILHSCHIGIVRMKALARSYFWWPNLDRDIEETGRSCEVCQSTQNTPARTSLHPWEWSSKPWSRLHIDIAGPYQNKLFLVLVDSCSKWLEVRIIPTTSSRAVIEALRDIMATHGLPDVIVSDNGTTFTSAEFVEFLRSNNIRRVTVAAYHPSSNGQAERLVKETKKTLNRLTGNWQTKLARFLFKQHSTPSTVTGVSPAELLMQRKLRTNLDSIRPSYEDSIRGKQEELAHAKRPPRQFRAGDAVYGKYQKKNPWLEEKIVERTGPISYKTRTADGIIHRRHLDQIRKRYDLDGEGEWCPSTYGEETRPKRSEEAGNIDPNTTDRLIDTEVNIPGSISTSDANTTDSNVEIDAKNTGGEVPGNEVSEEKEGRIKSPKSITKEANKTPTKVTRETTNPGGKTNSRKIIPSEASRAPIQPKIPKADTPRGIPNDEQYPGPSASTTTTRVRKPPSHLQDYVTDLD